jgi:membrane protease YdiL (CAAX protease family)
VVVTAVFAFVHLGPDMLLAAVWCLLVSALYLKTKSVGACVIAHAVSNLILGIYVMVTRQWGFW